MLESVYNSKIVEFAGNIERLGEPEQYDVSAKAHSKLCGSTVEVFMSVENDVVTEFGHKVKACALGQASSSIMARTIIGSTADELRQLRDTMTAMLKEEGPAPTGKFSDFKYLEPIREYRARHASALLTFNAVVDCLDQIEAARQAAE